MDAMDISVITATSVTLLSAFLSEAGKGFAKKTGEVVWNKTSELYNLIVTKIKGINSAEEALAELSQNPTDEDTQAVMRKQLKKIIISDPKFAKVIENLLIEVQQAGGDVIIQRFSMSGGRADTIIQMGKGKVEK